MAISTEIMIKNIYALPPSCNEETALVSQLHLVSLRKNKQLSFAWLNAYRLVTTGGIAKEKAIILWFISWPK